MLLKQTNNVRLSFDITTIDKPENTKQLSFIREFLDDEGQEVIHQTFFDMFLTDEEIAKLKEAL